MGILDVFRSKTKDLTDQFGGAATAVKDRTGDPAGASGSSGASSDAVTAVIRRVSDGMESAGQFADAKTGGKHSRQIDGAVDKAQDLLGRSPHDPAAGRSAAAPAGDLGRTAADQAPSAPEAVSGAGTDATDQFPR